MKTECDAEFAQDEPEQRIAEVKVSSDRGETWQRKRINFAEGVGESGLNAGEMFIWFGEKFEVINSEDGLQAIPVKKPNNAKKKRTYK